MKQTETQQLFVEIREPSVTRRDVLLATKDVLDSLKKYEEYSSIKVEKQKTWDSLKRVMNELLVLNRKLRSAIPKAPVPNTTLYARTTDVDSRLAREKEEFITGLTPSARPKSKLDILQEELSKIESRLSSLE